jgi:hypothetical protein
VAVAAFTALQIGFERQSVIPIHCGLISSYTTGLAVYDGIKILDKFGLGGRYFEQFWCLRTSNGNPIHGRNDGSILYVELNRFAVAVAV